MRREGVTPNTGNPWLEDDDARATWWVQATPGTTYWRCLVPARHLPGQALSLEINDLTETDPNDPLGFDMPRFRGDVAIWQFLGDQQRSRIAWSWQQKGHRTLMDVDDNYLRSVPKHLMKKSPWRPTIREALELKAAGVGTGYSNEAHRRDTQWLDGIICSTDYLADEYYQFNDNVWVCPNSIDPVDWQHEREESDVLRIGYYASGSHMNIDTPLVTEALKWAVRQEGVEIVEIGATNPAWSFKKTTRPWASDLVEARKHLFSIDIGIAPLVKNRWSEGKSDVKALEYAMAGVMPIVQGNVSPYEPWAWWPYTPVTKDDWSDVIRDVVTHREDVKARAAEAKAWVMENRTIDKTIHLWEAAIRG